MSQDEFWIEYEKNRANNKKQAESLFRIGMKLYRIYPFPLRLETGEIKKLSGEESKMNIVVEYPTYGPCGLTWFYTANAHLGGCFNNDFEQSDFIHLKDAKKALEDRKRRDLAFMIRHRDELNKLIKEKKRYL